MSVSNKMSIRMLNDESAINRINPYINSGPGTVRRTEQFSSYTKPMERDAQFEIEEEPSFSHGMPLGIHMKNTPCPMSRPLLPERNIDTGLTDYGKILVEKIREKKVNTPRMVIAGLIIAVLILLILRR